MRGRMVRGQDPAAAEIGQILDDLRDRISDLEKADQAAFRSIDDGAMDVYDDDDTLRARLGKQPDGSFTVKAFGKKPQTPTEPDVLPAPGGCIVEWDGTYEDAQPDEIHRIAIHVGTSADFDIVTGEEEDDSDLDATERAAIMSPRGGSAFLSVDPGEGKVWVRLTAVAEGGAESDPSPAVEVDVSAPEAAYHQDEFLLSTPGAQTLKLTYVPLDNSEHLYWNGLYQREDVAWDRIRKKVALSGLPFPPEVGDRVVVEYAYLLGEQPEEITYYRGTPKNAWYHGAPSLSNAWTDNFYIQFEEPIRDVWTDQLHYVTGNLGDYGLHIHWWCRDANGVLYQEMGSYTNIGIPYSGWGAGFGNGSSSPGDSGNADGTIYRHWSLYHSLGNYSGGIVGQHPHNLVGVQIYPYGGDDDVQGRAALGLTGGQAVPPGTMLPERGFFWLGEELPGMPEPHAPLGAPVPVP